MRWFPSNDFEIIQEIENQYGKIKTFLEKNNLSDKYIQMNGYGGKQNYFLIDFMGKRDYELIAYGDYVDVYIFKKREKK